MQGNLIYEFNGGVGDILWVYEDRIVIKHKGIMNFFIMGTKGDKTLYYSDITAVEFKKPGWTAGRIQFSLPGGRESTGGAFEAAGDENTITFKTEMTSQAESVVDYINERLREIKTGQTKSNVNSVSIADEIIKFKQLLDAGIITADEFEAKKKQLLNPNN